MTPAALTDEQLEQLANLGADRVIDHLTDTTTAGGPIDAQVHTIAFERRS